MARHDPETSGLDLSRDGGLRAAWASHGDEMFGYACRKLGDRAAAEEAVQETFLRAWRASSSYDASRPLRPWLFAILRHVVVDETRSRLHRALPRQPTGGDEAADGSEDGHTAQDLQLERLLDEWVVHEALRRIRDDQRTVIVRTYYQGHQYADVARDLGIPEATARTRAFYGLRALRLALDELGWEP